MTERQAPDPYLRFSTREWAEYRDGETMSLTTEDIDRLRTLNDPISREEAEEVYLPLARLLSLYVEAVQGLHRASSRFLNSPISRFSVRLNVARSEECMTRLPPALDQVIS